MSRRTVTSVADVRRALDTVVARHPGHHDPRVANRQAPRYLCHGEPSCLVAAVLDELGVSRGVMRDLDKAGPQRIDGTPHPLRRRFEPTAWALLGYLQRANDRGWWTWAEVAEGAFSIRDGMWGVPPRGHRFWRDRPWLTHPDDAEANADRGAPPVAALTRED